MKKQALCVVKLLLCTLFITVFFTFRCQENGAAFHKSFVSQRLISDIIITGNTTVHEKKILNALPYQIGELFDPIKTRQAINNLYQLGYFYSVNLLTRNIDDDQIQLIVQVTEKTPLKEVVIKDNKAVSDRDIFKKIPLNTISAIIPEELSFYAKQIRGLYFEKGYHDTIVETSLVIDENDKKGTAYFFIKEGSKTIVKQISFVGNNAISGKELRSVIVTHEDWLLGFLDKSGTYHPEKTEADKFKIEEFYQNRGFMNARVVDVQIPINPVTHNMKMIFTINEGDQYRIGSVKAPGNEILSEQVLLANIPIKSGDIYSRERLMSTLKRLESLWGDCGYVFAHINPSVQLNSETKTIDVTFYSEIGNKIKLRKITIKGNNKTRDTVIRRALVMQEGGYITRHQMESSKRNVSSLGYFDPNEGVAWKIIKQTPEVADLDLIVKEAKTGHLGFNLGFGGKASDKASPASGITMTVEFTESNLFGYGTLINANASWSKDDKSALLHIAQPWLFNKPITGSVDVYHRRPSYSQFSHLSLNTVHEILTGGALSVGYLTPPWISIIHNMHVSVGVGIDSIKYEKLPIAREDCNGIFQNILNQEFVQGDFVWLSLIAEQDLRNHPVHPSRGHRIKLTSRFGIPSFDACIGYFNAELEAHWYTPIIGERDLVFHLAGFIGAAKPFGDHTIPYGRLFHIGGDATVRGFGFGDISPKFGRDSIGAQKAFYVNAELIFPINPSMTMKGLFFYDGGAGWDNPYAQRCSVANHNHIKNNGFDYRHAVGFGLRILQPMPIRIDWGFKIDPRPDESSHQVHFGTSYDW